ncbi:hypothetical protein BJF78_30130 [Pseudonocardia sp. CNS-139]|nr:hypothetical protein BJF78_30130 [Pseudonocardia sp. CNS-139]
MSNDAPIQVSRLGELVAAVPVLTGFHPARSLVVILMKSGRVGLTVRSDLPEATESAQRYADFVAARIAGADVSADGAALIVVNPQHQQHHADMVSHLARALAGLGITADPRVWAEGTHAGQRWSCFDGCDDGVVPEATPLQAAYVIDGRAVLPSREAVAASIAPAVDDPTMRTRAAMVMCALADPSARRFADTQVMADALREWQNGQLVLDDARVALLVFALTDKEIRDHVVTWTIRDWADDAHALWAELVRQTPAPFVAEPAALLALTSMIKGETVLADAALRVAEAADPRHGLAGLVRIMHANHFSPGQLRLALEQILTAGRSDRGPPAGMSRLLTSREAGRRSGPMWRPWPGAAIPGPQSPEHHLGANTAPAAGSTGRTRDRPRPAACARGFGEGVRVTNERSRWSRDGDGVLRMNTQVQLRLALPDLARALFLAFEGDTLREVSEFGDLTFDRGQVARSDARMHVQRWLGRQGTDALARTAEPPPIYMQAARAMYWQRRAQPGSGGPRPR